LAEGWPVSRFAELWLSIVSHVANNHRTCPEGRHCKEHFCNKGLCECCAPPGEEGRSLKQGTSPRDKGVAGWLYKGSKGHTLLNEKLNKPKWSSHKELAFYLNDTHNYMIEIFWAVCGSYSPKRVALRSSYRPRLGLAGVDFNFHFGREELRPQRKYIKKSKTWGFQMKKTKKDYKYIPDILANMLHYRFLFPPSFMKLVKARAIDDEVETIAATPPLSTADIVAAHSQRFTKAERRV
jgi:hypothetical protein